MTMMMRRRSKDDDDDHVSVGGKNYLNRLWGWQGSKKRQSGDE